MTIDILFGVEKLYKISPGLTSIDLAAGVMGEVIEFDYSANFTGREQAGITSGMTTATASLNAFMLVLSWHSEPTSTYTIQTSVDLQDWLSLPFVMEGLGEVDSYVVDTSESPVFARLRYSQDGDTNENGLPDMWEWQQFGYLDVDPLDDPDGDGASNLVEWLEASDPLDYYNGEVPVIHISSGDEWLVPAGEISVQALAVSVWHPSGETWAGAPVSMRMAGGQKGLLAGGADPSSAVVAQVEWTDALGQINPNIHPLHVIASAIPGTRDHLVIEAGGASAFVMIHATGTDRGPPPRQLHRDFLDDGRASYSWSGPADGAGTFLLQERDPDGNWTKVIQLAVADLPLPDPQTGKYSLTIPGLQN